MHVDETVKNENMYADFRVRSSFSPSKVGPKTCTWMVLNKVLQRVYFFLRGFRVQMSAYGQVDPFYVAVLGCHHTHILHGPILVVVK